MLLNVLKEGKHLKRSSIGNPISMHASFVAALRRHHKSRIHAVGSIQIELVSYRAKMAGTTSFLFTFLSRPMELSDFFN